MYSARARSMRSPRTCKPPDEHCAVGRVRSQRHQSAARDRTIVFSDAPRGPSCLRTIPTIQTWKRRAVGAENVAPFPRAACDIPVAEKNGKVLSPSVQQLTRELPSSLLVRCRQTNHRFVRPNPVSNVTRTTMIQLNRIAIGLVETDEHAQFSGYFARPAARFISLGKRNAWAGLNRSRGIVTAICAACALMSGLGACSSQAQTSPVPPSAQPPASVRLWCAEPPGYYPSVQTCASGWQRRAPDLPASAVSPPVLVIPVQPPAEGRSQ